VSMCVCVCAASWEKTNGTIEFEMVGNGMLANSLTVVKFDVTNENSEHTGGVIWLDGYVETSSGNEMNALSASTMLQQRMATNNMYGYMY